jgi:hypothetical protein
MQRHWALANASAANGRPRQRNSRRTTPALTGRTTPPPAVSSLAGPDPGVVTGCHGDGDGEEPRADVAAASSPTQRVRRGVGNEANVPWVRGAIAIDDRCEHRTTAPAGRCRRFGNDKRRRRRRSRLSPPPLPQPRPVLAPASCCRRLRRRCQSSPSPCPSSRCSHSSPPQVDIVTAAVGPSAPPRPAPRRLNSLSQTLRHLWV